MKYLKNGVSCHTLSGSSSIMLFLGLLLSVTVGRGWAPSRSPAVICQTHTACHSSQHPCSALPDASATREETMRHSREQSIDLIPCSNFAVVLSCLLIENAHARCNNSARLFASVPEAQQGFTVIFLSLASWTLMSLPIPAKMPGNLSARIY